MGGGVGGGGLLMYVDCVVMEQPNGYPAVPAHEAPCALKSSQLGRLNTPKHELEPLIVQLARSLKHMEPSSDGIALI